MPRRSRFCLFLGLILPLWLAARPAWATSQAELEDRTVRAGQVFRELRTMPDHEIPADLIARSYCVAVIPNVIKAAWVLGGYYGRGVLSCRGKTGEWSPPVHVLMTGGSLGLQVGASSTDVVLFFMTTRSVHSMLLNKIKLSGEAAVAAGPVGRDTQAATDARFTAQIYSYARSRGLFAGVSFAGGYLGVQTEDTRDYYGASYSPAAILFDHKVTSVPKSAWTFLSALPHPKGVVVGEAPPAAASPAAKTAAKGPGPAPAANPVPMGPPPAAETVPQAPPANSTVLTPAQPLPPAAATPEQRKAAAQAGANAPANVESVAPAAPPIAPGPVTAPIEQPPSYGPASH